MGIFKVGLLLHQDSLRAHLKRVWLLLLAQVDPHYSANVERGNTLNVSRR